jgi:hypothetical protein
MFKKIFIAVLVLTVGGAFVLSLATAPQAVSVSAQDVNATTSANQGNRQNAGSGPVQQQQSTQNVGDPWVGIGTITALDSTGLMLKLADGSSVYVELGPSSYWQSQGITLAVDDPVTVQGFSNGGQYHAASVTTASGETLQVRNPSGQPLWSGSNGSQNGQGGTGQNAEQIPADQWVTLTGTVTAVNASSLTVQSSDKASVIVQLGRQSFVQEQNIAFNIGDEVEVQGFWQNDQFQAGQINDTTTGQRLMLRDPNGRPLWGGPGRNGGGTTGQGNGNGNGGQGNGNGNGGQGKGNGTGNANRNAQPTPQPSSQS